MSKTPNLDEVVAKGRGVERAFRCDVHDDHNASASVNVLKGLWVCYSCGASGRVGKGSLTAAMDAVVEMMKAPEAIVTKHPDWLNVYTASGSPYWVQRFGPRVARMFSCGTDPITGYPTYPIHSPQGQVWGVVSRTGADPKYLYPEVPVSRTLFGYHWAPPGFIKRVVVVEGAADVMAMHATRGRSKDTMIVGCYGAGLHAPQVDLINQLRPQLVVLAFDNDDAGERAGARDYPLDAQVDVVRWPYGVKDPAEATPSMRRKVLRHDQHIIGSDVH